MLVSHGDGRPAAVRLGQHGIGIRGGEQFGLALFEAGGPVVERAQDGGKGIRRGRQIFQQRGGTLAGADQFGLAVLARQFQGQDESGAQLSLGGGMDKDPRQ